jgi:hypothetical protein
MIKIEKKIVAYDVVDLAQAQPSTKQSTKDSTQTIAQLEMSEQVLEEHLNSIGLMKQASTCDKCHAKAILPIGGCLTCLKCGDMTTIAAMLSFDL